MEQSQQSHSIGRNRDIQRTEGKIKIKTQQGNHEIQYLHIWHSGNMVVGCGPQMPGAALLLCPFPVVAYMISLLD